MAGCAKPVRELQSAKPVRELQRKKRIINTKFLQGVALTTPHRNFTLNASRCVAMRGPLFSFDFFFCLGRGCV